MFLQGSGLATWQSNSRHYPYRLPMTVAVAETTIGGSCRWRAQSARSVASGSALAARRDGTRQARRAAPASTRPVTVNTAGSVGTDVDEEAGHEPRHCAGRDDAEAEAERRED